jgi:hypothetical protein
MMQARAPRRRQRNIAAMPDRVAKLRHCAGHSEHLLRLGTSADMAKVYLAELAVARAQLAEAERQTAKSADEPR